MPPSGGGLTWGNGTLLLNDGSQYAFQVRGLGVTSTGEAMVPLQAVGEVLNLQKVSEFSGIYQVTQSQVTAGRGSERVSLTNEHGVVVSLTMKSSATTATVTLTPSPTGGTVTLQE